MKRRRPSHPANRGLATGSNNPDSGSAAAGAGNAFTTRAWMVLGLLSFLLLQYPQALRAPFMGDDFLFLNRVRGASLGKLLAPNSIVEHYYRPWSRELHYWALQSLFGPNDTLFHVVNFLLALAALALFHAIVSREAGQRAAVIAVSGAALAAAWGTPLVWVAGVQDLWMLVLGMAFLWSALGRRTWLALGSLALALLSKETAAVLPAIATSHALLVGRRTPRDVVRSHGPYWIVLVLWAALHPMLGGAVIRHPVAMPATPEHAAISGLLLSALAVFNLDLWPRPGLPLRELVLASWSGAVILPLLAWRALAAVREPGAPSPGIPDSGEQSRPRVALWGTSWFVLAVLPLCAPGLLWQPYYALLGILGAWLALGTALQELSRLAPALLCALALLRTARAETPQALMGGQWQQERVATLTRTLRDDLRRLHPLLPAHSRVYFGNVPWGIGKITSDADSPALRVWYGDTTITGGFYSQYRARGRQATRGRDFFFLFGSDHHLVEVVQGAERLVPGEPESPHWESDHYSLACRLFDAGDVAASLAEWRKLTTVLPDRYEYALDFARCLQAAGDADSAGFWLRRAEALRLAAATRAAAGQ